MAPDGGEWTSWWGAKAGEKKSWREAGEEEMKWKELNEKSQEKEIWPHSAGRHTPHTMSGSSQSTMFWLILRKGIKCVDAIYIYIFSNNSDLFIGCKLYTVNVAQRQDIILLPTGKREGKKNGDREKWREGKRDIEKARKL